MKTLFKLIIPIFLLLGLTQTTFAQNATYKHNVHLGTGFSLTGALFSDFIADSLDLGINRVSSTPAIQATYDYGFSERFSIGLAVSHQTFALEQEGYDYVFLDDTLAANGEHFLADVNRNNVAVRLLWHYVSRERLDMYVAARYGVTYWKTDVEYVDTNTKTTETAFVPFAPQIALGLRYYVTPQIGFSIESGFGAPHFFNAGVNYRF